LVVEALVEEEMPAHGNIELLAFQSSCSLEVHTRVNRAMSPNVRAPLASDPLECKP